MYTLQVFEGFVLITRMNEGMFTRLVDHRHDVNFLLENQAASNVRRAT